MCDMSRNVSLLVPREPNRLSGVKRRPRIQNTAAYPHFKPLKVESKIDECPLDSFEQILGSR